MLLAKEFLSELILMFHKTKQDTLINYGLENNTDLLVAMERVKEAQAALKSAKLSFLPSVSLNPQGGLSYAGGVTSWSYDASVSASWEIDLFGKLLNNKRKAQVVLLQNEEYLHRNYKTALHAWTV